MLEIGSLAPSAGIVLVASQFGYSTPEIFSQCIGGDRVFDLVPPSTGLNDVLQALADKTFCVASLVLTAEA
ncbi:hypothetical protein GCM10011529_18740 [Polymorphobacter glacialis]|uniref:Uncharacterized protein n=1 Tax=Sandarakinorhabdus glacialis TaxID=1614636 RepID=A0A916ZSX7_9SPHN|nr:hypothetical protein GCM10011529_18740 [Polymorphobacter glacialis]